MSEKHRRLNIMALSLPSNFLNSYPLLTTLFSRESSPRALPQTYSPVDTKSFVTLQAIRAFFGLVAIQFVSSIFELGSPDWWLSLSIILALFLSGWLIRTSLSFLRVCLYHAGVLSLGILLFWVFSHIYASGDASNDFFVYRQAEHVRLFALLYFSAFVGNWYFWRYKHALTLEISLLAIIFVWLLSGHRNYYLDAPKQVSELAWNSTLLQSYDLGPQHILIGLGVLFSLLLTLYLYLASGRPLFRQRSPLIKPGKPRRLLGSILPLGFFLCFGLYAYYINARYSSDISRATNGVGVGEEQSEGSSPLGFHSAIGQTKQPAALVRLETDFSENPWTPMLYLREGALSGYSGRELVIASRAFDKDVPRSLPGKPYIALDSEPPGERKRVPQSVYLLTEHSAMFGLDVPLSSRLIRNPDPERFQLAYQVLSEAPTTNIADLSESPVGDPRWDKQTWDHYLRAPGSQSPVTPELDELDEPVLDNYGEDLRYKALSASLTDGLDSPIAKAASIINYLSVSTIYTRKPGHQVNQKGDPVAPYLFAAEKRGYCVHTAHAAVYLLRLAGIPSRIGTGYLTDLSYAKDGHILLQLGDRHAWPEIYVEDVGWTVFDVTPQQAEGEQELIPDESLLEQLMSKLDPSQDLFEPLPPEEATLSEENFLQRIAQYKIFLPMLCLAIFCWIIVKLYLRYGYLLAPVGTHRTRLAYASAASSLADIGVYRQPGETRREFQSRVQKQTGIELQQVTNLFEHSIYPAKPREASRDQIDSAVGSFKQSYDGKKTKWLRIISILSPGSLTRWFRW